METVELTFPTVEAVILFESFIINLVKLHRQQHTFGTTRHPKMNIGKLGKVPGLGGAVEKLTKLKALAECIKNIGSECTDIVKGIAQIGVTVGEIVSQPSEGRSKISDLKSSQQKVSESKKKCEKEVSEARKILEELKILGADEDGKGKIARVVDATFSLLENVCQMLEDLDALITKIDELAQAVEEEPPNVSEAVNIGKEIVDILGNLKTTLGKIQDDVVEIKNVIMGSGSEKKKDAGDAQSKGKAKEVESKGNGKQVGSDDEEPSCWSKICCCK